MSLDARIQQLHDLVNLIVQASKVVVQEWQTAATESPGGDPAASLVPSPALHDARRTIIGACGMLSDTVAEPQQRLMEMALGYYTSRALHIAAEGRVADILDAADPAEGLHIEAIARETGVERQKLARVLRALCTVHVFKEVKVDRFANTWTSRAMAGNDPLRCTVLNHGLDAYTASGSLLNVLFDSPCPASDHGPDTAFNRAMGTNLNYWEFLEQGVKQPDGTIVPRRELEIFGLAMLGSGRGLSPPLRADYPWAELGSGTVVDVGGGVGGMCLELAKQYPNLKFILQDRQAVIDKAKRMWQRELPEAVASQRITFMEHDFFKDQPVRGAEVYFMRLIVHDWPDDAACTILKRLHDAMGPRSRILNADIAMHAPRGSQYFKAAPSPLPANYGYAHQLAHYLDLNMMTLFDAKERSPEDLAVLASRASLRVAKVWECRGIMSITELRRIED